MRKALTLVAVLVALWSAGWFAAARSLERAAETWFAEAAADGLRSGYDHLSVAGYPARLSLAVAAPRLFDPLQAVGWQAEGLRASAAAWSPRHIEFALEGAQALTLGTARITLNGTDLGGTARLRDGAAEALSLTLRDGQAAIAPADVTLSLAEGRAEARSGETEAALDMTLAGLEVAGLDWPEALAPRPGGAVDRIALRAAVGLSAPPVERGRVEWLDLPALEVAWGDVRLHGMGRLEIMPDGRPEGRIDLEVAEWAPLVALAVALDMLDPEIAQTLLALLDAMAQDGPTPEVLSLPVVIRDGWMSVGPLPLGRAPRLLH